MRLIIWQRATVRATSKRSPFGKELDDLLGPREFRDTPRSKRERGSIFCVSARTAIHAAVHSALGNGRAWFELCHDNVPILTEATAG